MIIIVYGYGDFDMKYVDSVWEGPAGTIIRDLGDFDKDKDAANACRVLKDRGFKNITKKTYSVTFGGAY